MWKLGLYEFDGKKPKVDPDAYVSPRSSLIGDIEIGPDASIWEFAVLRADMNFIRVGKGTSIQDNCIGLLMNESLKSDHRRVWSL